MTTRAHRLHPLEPGAPPRLVERLRVFYAELQPLYRHPNGFPLQGMADLELVMQLLDLREFADWLRTHGAPDQTRCAADIISQVDTIDALDDAVAYAGGLATSDDPVKALEDMTGDLRGVRDVLVSVGALEAQDYDTPLPDLLRALLA